MKVDVAQSDSNAPPGKGEVLHGKYLLDELLGEGPFAWVYAARHRSIDALRFALKVLKPDAVTGNGVEARFDTLGPKISALQGRNGVRVFELGRDDGGRWFIAMERVRGLSLPETLRLNGSLEPLAATSLAAGIARGLAEGHAQGLVHRNLKPSNVLIAQPSGDPHPIAKILDHGLAEIMAGSDPKIAGDRFVSSPAYAAPEVLQGEPVPASDLYSLGLLLIEMLTGESALEPDKDMLLAARQLDGRPVDIPVAVAEGPLGALVARLVQKDPDARPGSADEVYEELTELREDLASASGTHRFRLDLGHGVEDDESETEPDEWHSGSYVASDDAGAFAPESTGSSFEPEGTPAATPFLDPRGENSGPVEVIADDEPSSEIRLPMPTHVRRRMERRTSPLRRVLPAILIVLLLAGAATWWLTRPGAVGTAPQDAEADAPIPTPAQQAASSEGAASGEAVRQSVDFAARRVARAATAPHNHLMDLYGDTPGAIVFHDEREIGGLPINGLFVGDRRPVRLRVTAPDHEPLELTFVQSGRIESWVALEPTPIEDADPDASEVSSRPARLDTERGTAPATRTDSRRPTSEPAPSAAPAPSREAPADREPVQEREAEPVREAAPAREASPAREAEPEPTLRHSDIRNPWGD